MKQLLKKTIKPAAVVLTFALALMLSPFLPESSETDVQEVVMAASAGSQDMYRLYNRTSGEHFYTADSGEKDSLVSKGWKYEGIGWVAPKSSNTPVYRLYNRQAGDHHYTMSEGEKTGLVLKGWVYEGIGWYSDDAQAIPLYRAYNPNAKKGGSHNYTTNKAEQNNLVKAGWNNEGTAWYAVGEGNSEGIKPDPSYIFVGDSRTVGMSNYVKGDTYISGVSDNYKGLVAEEAQIKAAESPNSVVIVALGINDLGNVNKYAAYLNKKPYSSKLYYMNITPVDETNARSHGYTVTNAMIDDFNAKMKAQAKNYKVLDANAYIRQTGFVAKDGIHYNNDGGDTYRRLNAWVKQQILNDW